MHGVLMIMLRYLDRIVKRSLVLMPLFLSACYVLYLLNGLHRFSAEQRPGDFGIVLARHTMATYHEIHKVSTLNQRSTVTMDDGLLLSNSFTTWKEGLVSNVQPVVTRNCSLLFSGDKNEIKRVKQAQEIWYDVFALELEYLELSYNCDWVRSQLGNNLFYISEEEREFPIAFALVVHENAMQIFRFLKVIYRPHNVYCIHIDTKASDFTKTFLYNIANCMHNIFIPLKLLSVIRGHGSSVFEAQMSCLRDLRHSSALAPWKYVITLCGKEIPLTTNREIVCRLKGLGGVSALNAVSMPKRLFFRINNLLPIPGNVTVYKGLMYHSLSRNFVEFLFENFTAINLYNHLIKGHIPEEHVLATLYMLPGQSILLSCAHNYDGVHLFAIA